MNMFAWTFPAASELWIIYCWKHVKKSKSETFLLLFLTRSLLATTLQVFYFISSNKLGKYSVIPPSPEARKAKPIIIMIAWWARWLLNLFQHFVLKSIFQRCGLFLSSHHHPLMRTKLKTASWRKAYTFSEVLLQGFPWRFFGNKSLVRLHGWYFLNRPPISYCIVYIIKAFHAIRAPKGIKAKLFVF